MELVKKQGLAELFRIYPTFTKLQYCHKLLRERDVEQNCDHSLDHDKQTNLLLEIDRLNAMVRNLSWYMIISNTCHLAQKVQQRQYWHHLTKF
jgi:hypothetical protein